LGALIDGLMNNGLEFYDYAVSGYIGSVSFLEKLATVIKELKEKNPDMVKNSSFPNSATGTNLNWRSDSWHKTKGHICPAQQPFIWIARVREGWATKK
jgi:hypothetical protein